MKQSLKYISKIMAVLFLISCCSALPVCAGVPALPGAATAIADKSVEIEVIFI